METATDHIFPMPRNRKKKKGKSGAPLVGFLRESWGA